MYVVNVKIAVGYDTIAPSTMEVLLYKDIIAFCI